jgi:hypothetical protein
MARWFYETLPRVSLLHRDSLAEFEDQSLLLDALLYFEGIGLGFVVHAWAIRCTYW